MGVALINIEPGKDCSIGKCMETLLVSNLGPTGSFSLTFATLSRLVTSGSLPPAVAFSACHSFNGVLLPEGRKEQHLLLPQDGPVGLCWMKAKPLPTGMESHMS